MSRHDAQPEAWPGKTRRVTRETIRLMPHISRLPSGKYRVIAKWGGRSASGTEDTHQKAQQRGARLLLGLGATRSVHDLTVSELLATAYVDAEARWSDTYRADVDAITERIPDRFMALKAGAVKPSDITGLYHRLEGGGWSAHRLRRLHEILSAAWNAGKRLELVGDNPLGSVRKPAAARRKLRIPDHRSVAAILNAVDGIERLALRISATTAARRGEVVALQWADVDGDTLTIRNSLAYTPASGVVEGNTKTGESGHRRIAIDPTTARMLAEHRAAQLVDAEPAGITPRWVFSDNAGMRPWRPDRLTHVFAKARDKAGAHGVRLHDLRHYVATTMLQDGEAPLDVAAQLGHASTATTLLVYAHFLPGRGRESAERRAARLDK